MHCCTTGSELENIHLHTELSRSSGSPKTMMFFVRTSSVNADVDVDADAGPPALQRKFSTVHRASASQQ